MDSIYMTLISVTTTGYKEIHELTTAGRIWTIFVILGGIVTGAVVLSLVVAVIVEGQLRRILGRRQLENKISTLSGHTIVCGFGHMGSLVAKDLKAAGTEVVIVDSNPECTTVAEEANLLYVLGNAQEEAALQAAGIEKAAVLVTALSSDAENVFLTLTARQANPKLRIIARAQQAASQQKLLMAGATRVVCPQIIGASRMVDVVIRPAVVDFVEMAHRGLELEMDQLDLTSASPIVGQTLEELALPRKIGAHVVAVRREDGKVVYHPTPDMQLAAGDTLVLVGEKGAAEAVEKLQLKT